MQHIFILGSRGYQAKYGGWETFVTNLVDHYHDKNTIIYVGELTDQKEKDKTLKKIHSNLYLYFFYVQNQSSAKMFFYTIKSYLNTLNYIKKNHLQNAYLYILGLKLGPLLAFHHNLRKKYHIKIYINPDGLEHLRKKWNKIIQKCFLLSEWSMVRNSDLVICDGLGIEKYINKKYPKAKTTYIAYGTNWYDFSQIPEKNILKEYNLKKDDYLLMVGRCVPENNYEFVIQEFMQSNIKKKLVIITNLSKSPYYLELKDKTNFEKDKRILFINGVYDPEKLATIRKNAYLYIHGHSVGGTNPSLIEALSLTDLNLLYDVCFNRDIGQNTCLYFKEKGSLTNLFAHPKYLEEKKKELGPQAKERVLKNFTWERIVKQYQEVFSPSQTKTKQKKEKNA